MDSIDSSIASLRSKYLKIPSKEVNRVALFHAVLSLYIATVVLIYFVPAILARNRTHATAIRVLNVLIGWTGIGWIALVIWALLATRQPPLSRPPV